MTAPHGPIAGLLAELHAARGGLTIDEARRRLSVVVEHGGGRLLITKGAPEASSTVCTAYEIDDRRAPPDEAMRERCETTYRELSAQGSRVLAVAYAVVSLQAVYSARDERQLVLAYLILVESVKRRLMRRLLALGPASPLAKSDTPAS